MRIDALPRKSTEEVPMKEESPGVTPPPEEPAAERYPQTFDLTDGWIGVRFARSEEPKQELSEAETLELALACSG